MSNSVLLNYQTEHECYTDTAIIVQIAQKKFIDYVKSAERKYVFIPLYNIFFCYLVIVLFCFCGIKWKYSSFTGFATLHPKFFFRQEKKVLHLLKKNYSFWVGRIPPSPKFYTIYPTFQ